MGLKIKIERGRRVRIKIKRDVKKDLLVDGVGYLLGSLYVFDKKADGHIFSELLAYPLKTIVWDEKAKGWFLNFGEHSFNAKFAKDFISFVDKKEYAPCNCSFTCAGFYPKDIRL